MVAAVLTPTFLPSVRAGRCRRLPWSESRVESRWEPLVPALTMNTRVSVVAWLRRTPEDATPTVLLAQRENH